MRGIEGYRGSDPESQWDMDRIIDNTRSALEIDPNFALAHAWLAYFYAEAIGAPLEDERAVYPKALRAVEKAIEIDKNMAMAYSSRACLKLFMDWDFAGAEEDFQKALALAPGDMWIPIVYETFYLCFSGRGDDAIESLGRRMAKRFPTGLEFIYALQQTKHYLWAGRYNDALTELGKIPPTHPMRIWLTGPAKALMGAPGEALNIWDKIKDRPLNKNNPWFRRDYAWMLALAGRREEALQAMTEHIAIQAEKNIDTTYDQACIYAGLGDNDTAFELLYKAYDRHSSQMIRLVSDWALHSLHGDPRFEELAKKVGFPAIPRIRRS